MPGCCTFCVASPVSERKKRPMPEAVRKQLRRRNANACGICLIAIAYIFEKQLPVLQSELSVYLHVSVYLHAEKFLGAPAGLAEEAGGMALVHEDDGVVLVCQSLKERNYMAPPELSDGKICQVLTLISGRGQTLPSMEKTPSVTISLLRPS